MKSFIEQFRGVDGSAFGDIYSSNFGVLEQAFWVLIVSKKVLGRDYVNADEIAEVLTEGFDIRCKSISIKRALARCGDKINVRREGKQLYYRIMRRGEEQLARLSSNTDITLVYIEHGKPWTG